MCPLKPTEPLAQLPSSPSCCKGRASVLIIEVEPGSSRRVLRMAGEPNTLILSIAILNRAQRVTQRRDEPRGVSVGE